MRWIFGDVHGMLKPLETLLTAISRHDAKPLYYFVGDYVNRGKESKGVIDLLLTLTNARFIRGNHDDVLDQILHGAAYSENASRGDRFLAFQWFLEHGLLETLESYGVTRDMIGRVITHRTQESINFVVDQFPESHRRFIRALPVLIEDDDLFVIHGKWPLKEKKSPAKLIGDGVQPNPKLRQEILWGRFDEAELTKPQNWPKRGFFGHTPVQTYVGYETNGKPIIASKLMLLDTAAALSPAGRLTAVCAENSQIIQSDPTGQLV